MSEERLLLTNEQKASFDADGFLHLRGFYSAEEMEEMRRLMDEIEEMER